MDKKAGPANGQKNIVADENGYMEDIYIIVKNHFFNKGADIAKLSLYKSMVHPPNRPIGPFLIDTEEGLILFFETEV